MEDARRLGDVKICMIGSSGGDVSFPITTAKGGTGNTAGYIRTGQKANTEMGENATAEGYDTESSGDHSHAEGDRTVASGYATHAEGSQSTASGNYSHAESKSTASGEYSHAEGSSCVASGKYSHAGGNTATASGWGAFAHGEAVTAGYSHQTVVGHGNDNKSGTLFEVGNGTGLTLSDVSNAFEVYSDGKISCDNGASKFQFTQNSGVDGYYDASGTWHAFVSGGGSSIKKTRYTISSSSWSASANSDGYYTYTQTLDPAVKSSPDVYVAGSTDSTQPTDAQRVQFGYVERCKVNSSTLTLYAKTKPTATFYIWVEGEEGTASGDIVGNVVKPNEQSSVKATDFSYEISKDSFTLNSGINLYQAIYDITANDADYNDIKSATYGMLTLSAGWNASYTDLILANIFLPPNILGEQGYVQYAKIGNRAYAPMLKMDTAYFNEISIAHIVEGNVWKYRIDIRMSATAYGDMPSDGKAYVRINTITV